VRKKLLVAVAAACLIGAIIAALSTTQYLRIQKEGLEQKSFCSISETIDCDIASASSYSRFAGVPIAWFGLVTYLLIGGMALFGAVSKKDRKATVTIAWFISIAAVLYSIWLVYILITVLQVTCLECLGMYIVNLFTAIALLIALGIRPKNLGKFLADYVRAVFKKKSDLGFAPKLFSHAIVIIAVLGLGWIIMYDVQGKGGEKSISLKEKMNAHYMQSLYAIEANPAWPVWGNPEGAVTVIEFSDFECPFCKLAAFNIKPYLHEFRKNVRFYFVNTPLDQACNPYMERPMHQKACMAAAATLCAQDRGDFWGFHDDLFRIQKSLSKEEIVKLAQKREWNTDEFSACMDSAETKARILEGIETSRKFHISGTPTLIVNGRRLKYWRDPEFLQAVVKEEIKRSKKR